MDTEYASQGCTVMVATSRPHTISRSKVAADCQPSLFKEYSSHKNQSLGNSTRSRKGVFNA